jgi:hypothetical protein
MKGFLFTYMMTYGGAVASLFRAGRLLPIARGKQRDLGAEMSDLARMSLSSIPASLVACSFVTVEAVEAPVTWRSWARMC